MATTYKCHRCDGAVYINVDNDLTCRMCGATIVLTVRRNADVQGIRKNIEEPKQIERMESMGMQRRKGGRRKFL